MSRYFQIRNFERVSKQKRAKTFAAPAQRPALPLAAGQRQGAAHRLHAPGGALRQHAALSTSDPGAPDRSRSALWRSGRRCHQATGQAGFIEPIAEHQLESRSRRLRLSDSVRAQVLLRDGARCRRCGSTLVLEVDHIEPVRSGGDDDFNNLQTLCRRCNRRKGSRTAATL